MATDQTFQIKCPSCGATLNVKPEWAGREAECTSCGKALTIPSPPAGVPGVPAAPGAPAAPAAPAQYAPGEGGAIDLARMKTSGETTLRVVCLIFAILIYIPLVISCLGIIYLGSFMLFSYLGLAFMMAHVRGNGIKVGPDQLPEVYESARRAAAAMGLAEVPDVYVIQAGGILNAFATKFAFRKYVVMYSDLVDACGDNTAELDMIMAHEIGHLALKHITWMWILFPTMLIPFLSQGYSRACEYSADRCGWAGCGNDEAAARGLLILAAGGKYARMASLEAFIRQRQEVSGFWQTVVEWFSTHPWLTRRVEALNLLSRSAGGA